MLRPARPVRYIIAAVIAVIFISTLVHPTTSRAYLDGYDITLDQLRKTSGWSLGSGLNRDSGQHANYSTSHFPSQRSAGVLVPGSAEGKDFWKRYAQVLTDAAPGTVNVSQKADIEGFPMRTYSAVQWSDAREDRLYIPEEEMEVLRDSHARAVQSMQELGPELPYIPGTRGIVVTTSVEAMAFLAVSMRMLRKVGSRLPVELWVYDRDLYLVDPYLIDSCRDIFAPLNVKCMFMSDFMPKRPPKPLNKEPVKYQNKLDALLFSTFEQVLWLDSDVITALPPDALFEEAPFTHTGFVLWPDYWEDTSSQYFYDLSGIEPEPLVDRASTESGELMINKATHASALLMASYYTRHGDSHYFQLFSQGAMGMGDKETFRQGVRAMGLPFYQVVEVPARMGYRCDGNERAIGSGQHHPGDDLYLVMLGMKRPRKLDLLGDGTAPRIQFIHGNLPKYDPARYLDWYDPVHWNDQLRCDKGKGALHRMYGPRRLMLLKFGWDIEKSIFDQMVWVACHMEKYQITWRNGTFFNNWRKRTNVCEDMVKFRDDLFGAEGLPYDDTLISPYYRGGEVDVINSAVDPSSWQAIRNPMRWARL